MSEPTIPPPEVSAAPARRVRWLWFLPRFTVRGLMIAGAVAGVVMAARELSGRRAGYLMRAGEHSSQAWHLREAARNTAWYGHGLTDLRHYRERSERAATWHDSLRSKYERAARSPWLPVGPDPPEPE